MSNNNMKKTKNGLIQAISEKLIAAGIAPNKANNLAEKHILQIKKMRKKEIEKIIQICHDDAQKPNTSNNTPG